MAAQPRIVSRREWGAATTIPGGRGVAPSSRRFFVVHWPVMSSRDERQWCRDIERMHRGQGWAAAPGYNYLVGMSGTIFEGCGRDVRGIHSPPRNTDGWGVCVLQPSTAGGSPTAPISQAAKNSTRALYDWLCTVAGRALNRSWHGADFATACPGPDLTAWVRGGMHATGGAAPAPTPPPPQPVIRPGDKVEIAVMRDGRFEAFYEDRHGRIWHTWQAREGGWVGAQQGRRAQWFSLGQPGG
jgi:hypothetical protein